MTDARAQNLRKNMTPEERHLWYDFLKQLPVTVRRQKVLGSYIVDFFIASANLVIEVDGSQHFLRKDNPTISAGTPICKAGGFGFCGTPTGRSIRSSKLFAKIFPVI